jgi:ubiquinone/menaquinone biosynthesis C-methylase UbiE
MLERILEVEVMDTPEEARDYDAMDHRAVNEAFVTDFLRVWDGQGPVLDVGTGTAQIPIVLCRRHARAEVVAIDYAEHMLRIGQENIRRAALHDRIRLERCDAKVLPFADRSFGAVISNSIVHHIPEPGRVIGEMVRVVRPGGTLFVRDLLRPNNQEELDRLVGLYAGDANEHQRQMFADSLRAALTLSEVRGLVAGEGFGPETVQQTSDRHWTWSATRSG